MSIESKLCAVVAALTVVGGVGAVETLSASAATPACGPGCISIFSRELGTYAQPGPVEDVLDGVVRVGQPVILKAPASASDPSQDTIPHRRPVSEWYADGMVSAAVNAHYGSLPGVQIESAPYGMPS